MLNALIIGNGHYATGATTLQRATDKDGGVLLPTLLTMRDAGYIGEIGIAARDGDKLASTYPTASLRRWPRAGVDETAYLDALTNMPRPFFAVIAVPDHMHETVMSDCALYGVPFLVVKPAVTNVSALDRVLDLVRHGGVIAAVDYHKTFDPANVHIRRHYRAGDYGSLQHAYSFMTQRRSMLDIYARWSDTGLNVNHYLGSHYAHLVGWITGAHPTSVRATSQGTVARSMGIDTPDTVQMSVDWDAGFTSYHVSGWADPHETESMTYQELHLLTDKGHVDSEQRYRGLRTVMAGQGYGAPNPHFYDTCQHPLSQYGFDSIFEFARAVERSDTSGLCLLEDSRDVTTILHCADISLAMGGSVVTTDLLDATRLAA